MLDTYLTQLRSYYSIDLGQMLFYFSVLAINYMITLPLALERTWRAPGRLGFRTISLVSLSCCAFVLMALAVFSDENAQSKFFYGVLTGIGFIGGGALFRSDKGVYGTASAASVWAAAGVGIASGLGCIEIALVLSILVTITLHFFSIADKDSDTMGADS